jgi:hypothetical protein
MEGEYAFNSYTHGMMYKPEKVAFLGHVKVTRESGIIPHQQGLLNAFHAKNLLSSM